MTTDVQRFTKIKFDGSKVRLEYEIPKQAGDPDEFFLHSADLPAPEFNAALQALAVDVVAICELVPTDIERLTIRGVTLTHTHDILGVVVTALKRLKTANAPMVINTPHLPFESYSDNPDEPTMPSGMRDRLAVVEVEAQRYLDGERAQATLFASTESPEPALA